MAKYLITTTNVRESLEEALERFSAECSDFNKMADEVYSYLIDVKWNNKVFCECETMNMVRKYVRGSEEAIKDVWAVIVMYGFENLYYKLIGQNKHLVSECLRASYEAAKRFEFDKEVRLITFLYRSISDQLYRHAYDSLIRLPTHAQLVRNKMVKILEKNPHISDEALAEELEASLKTIKSLRSIQSQIASIETSPGSNNSKNAEVDPLSTFLQSSENVEAEYADSDLEKRIRTQLVGAIGESFTYKHAYVCKHRIGDPVGCKKMGFEDIRSAYCRYLLICEELNNVGSFYKNLREDCKRLQAVLACDNSDETRFKYELGKSDEKIRCAVSNAELRYKDMIAGKTTASKSKYLKTNSCLQQMVYAVFPSTAYAKKISSAPAVERQEAFRFRLREMGLNEVANKLLSAAPHENN